MSAAATAKKTVQHVMPLTTYVEHGRWGFHYSNGPVLHRQDGFASEVLAEAVGRQDRAETIAYAHRFEPRLVRQFDTDLGHLVVTGWVHKCACGLVRIANNQHDVAQLIRCDQGPCPAAIPKPLKPCKARAASQREVY